MCVPHVNRIKTFHHTFILKNDLRRETLLPSVLADAIRAFTAADLYHLSKFST